MTSPVPTGRSDEKSDSSLGSPPSWLHWLVACDGEVPACSATKQLLADPSDVCWLALLETGNSDAFLTGPDTTGLEQDEVVMSNWRARISAEFVVKRHGFFGDALDPESPVPRRKYGGRILRDVGSRHVRLARVLRAIDGATVVVEPPAPASPAADAADATDRRMRRRSSWSASTWATSQSPRRRDCTWRRGSANKTRRSHRATRQRASWRSPCTRSKSRTYSRPSQSSFDCTPLEYSRVCLTNAASRAVVEIQSPSSAYEVQHVRPQLPSIAVT